MSTASAVPVIFDCNVFARALISIHGAAGACIVAAQTGRARLLITHYIIAEIRQLPAKLPPRLGVTQDRVDRFVVDLGKYVEFVEDVPPLFQYSRDPDDTHYVDLAIATGAMLVVSNDRDLLDLMDDANAEGKALRVAHPAFQVLTPPQFLKTLSADT